MPFCGDNARPSSRTGRPAVWLRSAAFPVTCRHVGLSKVSFYACARDLGAHAVSRYSSRGGRAVSWIALQPTDDPASVGGDWVGGSKGESQGQTGSSIAADVPVLPSTLGPGFFNFFRPQRGKEEEEEEC